ncbi:hypothetical protein EDB86DRAFT_2824886 [Lactarius hatsudake]|nr:hypothetical protein EDB86DRAFT_2824886 [Lactarius hatsudake]
MSALLNRLLGAFFVGVVFSSILYGVTWLQVYLYFTEHSSKDGAFLKSFSARLDTLGTPLSWVLHSCGYELREFSGRPSCPMVQSIIGDSTLSGFTNSVLSVTEFGFAIVFTVKSFQMGSYLENAPSVPYGASALSLEVACGVFITVGMVYYVLQQRSGAKRTKRVVNLVILYIINSGALNLVFASTCLITYVKFPTTLIYAPSFFVLVRLYSSYSKQALIVGNRLNSRVNVRSKLRGERRTIVTITHEQVIDGHPQSTLKLGSHSSSEMLAMMRIREGTAEKAVGVDEDIC